MAITNVVNANGTTPLPVGQGGTSTTSLTVFALLKGDAAGHVSSLAAGTNGQLPIGSTAADPVMATLTAGTGISITNGAGSITIDATGVATDIAGDSGTATGSTITFDGTTDGGASVSFNASGATVTLSIGDSDNCFVGSGSGNNTLSGDTNTCLGESIMPSITSGTFNTGMGAQSLQSLNTGSDNAAYGRNALGSVTSGGSNIAMGSAALGALVDGAFNIGIGYFAGQNYTGTESSNILLSNAGVLADSNTIRIGTEGSGAGEQDTCFIAGIANSTVTGSPVLVDVATGQLGLAVSSQRFKQNIIDMGKESDGALKLRPVTFSYKQDVTNAMQYGLIAEEVADVMPHLVTYDAFGQPYTVRYGDLSSILLNEVQKLSKRVAELEAKCKE